MGNQAVLDGAAEKLSGLDLHSKLAMFMIRSAVLKWKEDVPTAAHIRPPQREGPLEATELPFAGLELPISDEDWPAPGFQRKSLMWLLTRRSMKVRDSAVAWSSPAEAITAFERVLAVGPMLPRPTHRWSEMRSDAAMSRIAFAGMGALRLRPLSPEEAAADPDGAAWVHDMRWMGAYDVRPGFERYGAAAYFDRQRAPIRIRWTHAARDVRPGDPDWEHAKWVWRCTLLVGTTVADHLVGVHWMIANYTTTSARNHLGPDHPLRRLLKPFTWRTVTINHNAVTSLCPERGFVHRAAALTYPELLRAFTDSTAMLRWRPVPEYLAEKGPLQPGDDFPWLEDGLALYAVIEHFVHDYMGRYFTGDSAASDPQIRRFWRGLAEASPPTSALPELSRQSLLDMLSQFIWTVTGLHESAGAVLEYVIDPSFTGTKIRPGRELADVQSSIQALLVIGLTGLEMPGLLGDFSQVCLDDAGREAFAEFRAQLYALADRIDAANRHRRWPCNWFNPRVLECSVSI